jgi:hypothetical protein
LWLAGEEEEGRRTPTRRRGSRDRGGGDKSREGGGGRPSWSEPGPAGAAGGAGTGGDRESGWGGWAEAGAGSGQAGREGSSGWGGWVEGSGTGPSPGVGGEGTGGGGGGVGGRPKGAFFHTPVGERRYRRPEKSDQPAQGGSRGGVASPTATPASDGSPPPSAGSDQVMVAVMPHCSSTCTSSNDVFELLFTVNHRFTNLD